MHVFSSSDYCICVLILLYASSYCYICVLLLHTTIRVLMRAQGPTNAYVWHTWVLGKLGDVCAVVQLGKLDGKHLSMILSLVSRDPALS
jgi:hypothetical protein